MLHISFKSLKSCKDIASNIDKQLGNFTAIGRHKNNCFEDDVKVMVEELKKENLLEPLPGRAHKTFSKIKLSPTLNWDKTSQWIRKNIQKMARAENLKMLVGENM